MGGGQDAQATVSSPPGVKIIKVGVKIPREILTPGGQAARGYLDPRGSSCPGVKINRYTGPDRFLVCKTDSICIKRIFFGPKKHTLRIIYWPNYLD